MSGRSWWKAWASVTSFVTAFDNSVLVGCGVFSVHSSGSHENVTHVVSASDCCYWTFWEDGPELRVVVNEVPVFGQYSTDVWYIWVVFGNKRYARRGLLSFVSHSIFSFDTAYPFNRCLGVRRIMSSGYEMSGEFDCPLLECVDVRANTADPECLSICHAICTVWWVTAGWETCQNGAK
jgi:hypothetical protein